MVTCKTNKLNSSKNLSDKTELNVSLTVAKSYLRFQFYSLSLIFNYPNIKNANHWLGTNYSDSLSNSFLPHFIIYFRLT